MLLPLLICYSENNISIFYHLVLESRCKGPDAFFHYFRQELSIWEDACLFVTPSCSPPHNHIWFFSCLSNLWLSLVCLCGGFLNGTWWTIPHVTCSRWMICLLTFLFVHLWGFCLLLYRSPFSSWAELVSIWCGFAHASLLSYCSRMDLKLDPLKAIVHQLNGCLSSFCLLHGLVTNGVEKTGLCIKPSNRTFTQPVWGR